MKNIILIAISAFSLNYSIAQGLKLNDEQFSNVEKWEPEESYGYSSSTLPSKLSFRKYTPYINNQGQTSTCVGQAVAYAQLTTQQNIAMGVTNENQKICRAMDPNFIYALIKDSRDSWCQNGTSLSDAMDVLKYYGCKPLLWSPWLSCDDSKAFDDMSLAIASNYRISEYYGLIKDEDFVKTVKTALSMELIVSVGMQLTESFVSGSAVKYGDWTPKSGESFIGGHAMCVVGYDNTRNGGSFEVMNSYGSEYGDKGFVWIKYSDFINLVSEAYVVSIDGFKKGDCSYGDCSNTFSRYKFNSGDVYEGLVIGNLPDVFGSYLYTNGDFYVGDFKAGRKHGTGVYFDYLKSTYYLTYFENDVLLEYDEVQEFSSSENKEKSIKVLDILQAINTAKVVTDTNEDYQELMDNIAVPQNGLVIGKSDK